MEVRYLEIQEYLVKQAVLGDDMAFSEIYRCIYKDMYRYAYYMLGNEHDAEDTVSDAVMDIYIGLEKLRDYTLFKAWAFKILSNKCKKRRKQYISKNVSIDDENVGIHLKSKETDLEQKYDIENALNSLKYDEKAIVVLSSLEGYKSDEIGEILNMKPVTARSKLKRALEKMQKKLKCSQTGSFI